MENGTLKTPLFVKGFFNRTGKRMRAIYLGTVSKKDRQKHYRLWRKDGKSDNDYPHDDDDRYYLMVEIGEYLVPLRCTMWKLIQDCGYEKACEFLYGSEEGRVSFLKHLDNTELKNALDKEEETVRRFGCDPETQADWIQREIDREVNWYRECRDSGGTRGFPSYIGAAAINEISECHKVRALFEVAQSKKDQEWKERADREYKEEIRLAQQDNKRIRGDALRKILEGGTIRNDFLKVPVGNYSFTTLSIVLTLFDEFHVELPARTKGWIRDKLIEVTIRNGNAESARFNRKSKNEKGSQTFFECMERLIYAVNCAKSEEIHGEPQ